MWRDLGEISHTLRDLGEISHTWRDLRKDFIFLERFRKRLHFLGEIWGRERERERDTVGEIGRDLVGSLY